MEENIAIHEKGSISDLQEKESSYTAFAHMIIFEDIIAAIAKPRKCQLPASLWTQDMLKNSFKLSKMQEGNLKCRTKLRKIDHTCKL